MAIAEITTALGAIKATTDAIGAVLKADKALGEAELKFRLAEAAQQLLDAKVAVLDAQSVIEKRDQEIKRLEEALQNKAKVTKVDEGYYEIDAAGGPTGPAYCMRCYEIDHRLFHLSYPKRTDEPTRCVVCKAQYAYHRTGRKGTSPASV
ncbi:MULTISPECIES: hypothetical protein [unclassified Lysobacter]|uniref:hypothetical protein n=1 Tax=unclassified Lysobacter TaxID=2635362 RepID=UPI001BE5D0C2|nr:MULTISPECIES: hypothetical protein [unclassified Lysobacter]MBT2746216.1 hypothetical protein [Lysobacter sp. ISL-42]MBT2750761.1 hypothetical protein [Lysobacter sp. ISL-50]MBT2776092.1 hypothetical protein [Lysobacter sp. ISL-54]MBT2784598.1 hypothetical protein [Lysobacter sp. ISL-52]